MDFQQKNEYIERESKKNGMEYEITNKNMSLVNSEFWPIDHPVEPPTDDRPVNCPSANTLVGIEKRFWRSFGRKSVDSPNGIARKRPHAFVHGDHTKSHSVNFHRKSYASLQDIAEFQKAEKFKKIVHRNNNMKRHQVTKKPDQKTKWYDYSLYNGYKEKQSYQALRRMKPAAVNPYISTKRDKNTKYQNDTKQKPSPHT